MKVGTLTQYGGSLASLAEAQKEKARLEERDERARESLKNTMEALGYRWNSYREQREDPKESLVYSFLYANR